MLTYVITISPEYTGERRESKVKLSIFRELGGELEEEVGRWKERQRGRDSFGLEMLFLPWFLRVMQELHQHFSSPSRSQMKV